jgi:hypothetical protein
MELKASKWYDFAAAIERGPLVYSLKIRDKKITKDRNDGYRAFEEVYPVDEWKYGLIQEVVENLSTSVKVVANDWNGDYPWNLENAPIELKMKGLKVPDWNLANGAPVLPAFWGGYNGDELSFKEITLVPYGCTTLRITEFPVYDVK